MMTARCLLLAAFAAVYAAAEGCGDGPVCEAGFGCLSDPACIPFELPADATCPRKCVSCATVSCLAVACQDNEESFTPEGQCCPACRPVTACPADGLQRVCPDGTSVGKDPATGCAEFKKCECTTNCKHKVPHGFDGPDDGDNSCNHCTCDDGHYSCTEKGCGPDSSRPCKPAPVACKDSNDCAAPEICRPDGTCGPLICCFAFPTCPAGTISDACTEEEVVSGACVRESLCCSTITCRVVTCESNKDCAADEYCKSSPGGRGFVGCTDEKTCHKRLADGKKCQGGAADCHRLECMQGSSCNAAGFCEAERPKPTCATIRCPGGTFCSEQPDGTQCSGEFGCTPFSQEGERCGGRTLPCFQRRCAPGLRCVGPALVFDGPGECKPVLAANSVCFLVVRGWGIVVDQRDLCPIDTECRATVSFGGVTVHRCI